MDLSTRYLGLALKSPFMPGASPLVDDLDTVLRLEDAGAAAIVMHSLFEEQIASERLGAHQMQRFGESFHEARSFVPDADEYALASDRYAAHLGRIKRRVHVPVIASLNGITAEGWLEHARVLQQAGADALELNFYHVATELSESALAAEHRILDIAAVLKESLGIPLAVKLSPFFSSLPNLAWQLDLLGVDGLILFNRFYQPDIDPEALEAVPRLQLSDSSELLLRLRWIAILFGRLRASLAVSGGVHEAIDAVKAIVAGADVLQMVSALLRHGPERLALVRDEFVRWIGEHGYNSLAELRGSMSHARCPDPNAFERGNYIRVLQSWRPALVDH